MCLHSTCSVDSWNVDLAPVNSAVWLIWCVCVCSLQYAGASWDELKYIRQAVGFLVRTFCPPLGCCPHLEASWTYWASSGVVWCLNWWTEILLVRGLMIIPFGGGVP